jgi:hypothetical protein
MSAQSALNIFLGGRKVMFDKRTILPNCGGTNGAGCNQDLIDGVLDPPDIIIPAGWVTSIGGSLGDPATDITMDKSDSYGDGKDYVLVTGIYTSTDLRINDYDQLNNSTTEIETSLFGVINETTTDQKAYIVKYDNTNGHAKWATKIIGVGGNTVINTDSIKTDSSGNVYVSGRIRQNTIADVYTVRFFSSSDPASGIITPTLYGSIRLSTSVSGQPPPPQVFPKTDTFLVKYNKDGIVQRATLIGNNATSNAYQAQTKTSITIDSNDYPWISGSYTSTTSFYTFSSVSPVTPNQLITLSTTQSLLRNGRNGFIAKYSQDLTTLEAVTSIGIEETLTDVRIRGIASYGSGVFVVGSVNNSDTPNPPNPPNPPYPIKFNSCSSSPLPPPPSFIVTVSATSSNISPSSGINTNFIAWYDSACVFNNHVLIGSTTSIISNSIDVDIAGSVYITGVYTGTLSITNSGPPPPSGNSGILAPVSAGTPDGFLIKYTTTTTPTETINLDWATTIANLKSAPTLTIDKSSSPNFIALTGILPSDGIVINNFSGFIGTAIQTTPYGSLAGSVTSGDALLAKYTVGGSTVWATADRGVTGSDEGTGVTTDSDGNVVVCGAYFGNLNVEDYANVSALVVNTTLFGYLAPTTLATASDSFIAKYMKNTGSILNA